MTITDGTLTRLRTAATAGDARSAFDLARLLSLVPYDPDDPDSQYEGGQSWPEEDWLRAILDTRPSDVPAMTLLVGRLAQRIDYWLNVEENNPDAAEDETTLEAWQGEVEELMSRIRTADTAHTVPAQSLAELAELLDEEAEPDDTDGDEDELAYDCYVMDDTAWSGSVAHCATIVTTCPDELRWACDRWFSMVDGCGMSGSATLTTYVRGEEASVIDLAEHFDDTAKTLDWDAFTLPPLTGERLPAGLPVPGQGLFYGFAATVK
ncbi:hypothetical protein [Streptomyces sp. NPDC059010]|uniref:hypothetical protein n=1 Tax=Streptomyces sp. NPDC059010 TaxID=3346695 RepID=UPI0036833A80